MQQKILGTFIITLFLAETFFIYPNVDFSVIQDSKDSVILEQEFIPDNVNKLLSAGSKAFTENRGQLENDEVRFYDQGGSVWFTDDGVWFELREYVETRDQGSGIKDQGDSNPLKGFEPPEPMEYKSVVLKHEFVGANQVRPVGNERISWNSSFFYGNDSSKWCINVPNYQEVFYENIYHGIDLRYYTNKNGLKYDFILHPGANAEQIRIKYVGNDGLGIDDSGDLIIKTSIENIVDGHLWIYQNNGRFRQNIEGKFKIYNNFEYGFEMENDFNKLKDIIIDPLISLECSTYFGGNGIDYGDSIAVDSRGNTYIIGGTMSTNFPTSPGAFDKTLVGTSDFIVFKLNPIGSNLVYSTYIGGNSNEWGYNEILLDNWGNAYVTGSTRSSDFPTTNGSYDESYNNLQDAFVFKLNWNGSKLLFSTYLGGSLEEVGLGIALDSKGDIFVTGSTSSNDFPVTLGGFNQGNNGDYDVFTVKLNANASTLIYSTYIGGNDTDTAYDIDIDSAGNAYITGTTNSLDFPTTPGANDTNYNGGSNDVFLLKLNQTGSSLIYSTYIGGSGDDWSKSLAVDPSGNAIVCGSTESYDFQTTVGAYDRKYNGSRDIFVAKINHNGSIFIFSTFIGGNSEEWGYDIALGSDGCTYVTGSTYSHDFPITFDAFDKTQNMTEVYIILLNNNGSTLLYSTFLGGSLGDVGGGIALDPMNQYVCITGETWSSDFPTTPGAFNNTLSGSDDAFMVKFKLPIQLNISKLTLVINNTPTNLIYARRCPYTFRVEVIDTVSVSDLVDVRLTLDYHGTNIKLLWNRSTDQFTEISDPNNYILIDPSSKAVNHYYLWIIDFNITFNWNYPDEDFHNVQIAADSIFFSKKILNATDIFRVENDLVFNGSLMVKNEVNLTVHNNDLIRGGEQLQWTGLVPVYEDSIDIYPPEAEVDIMMLDDDNNYYLDSPAAGSELNVTTIVPKISNYEGFGYIINLTGIPKKCDKTNESFRIRIDADNVSFSNPIPNKNIWQTTSDVEVGINIIDIGGGFVNGSSVKYCFSTDNGTNWSEWKGFLKLKSGVSVNPQDVLIFPDGINNLVKWQAGDSVGNGPVESEEYQILVDTEDIIFSNGYPTEQNESPTENVEAGITISDTTSGVDISAVEYAISINSGASWTLWKLITGLNSVNRINVTLSLKFPNGTGNRIKWRASDIAGNGPIESKAIVIRVNTWVEEFSILKVKLWSPPNGSIISSTALELSWRLLNTELLNVYYDIYLDTAFPPIKINHSGIINTTVIIDDLSNGVTYYWTVIPKTMKINGSCKSGVWSFTITIPIPKINLIFPENNSIINDFQPRLSWSVEYDGTEILSYNVYFGTSEDPELEFKNHPSTNCFIKDRLTDGETYYWKVESWAGDYPGPISETWSFTVSQEYIPHFELELFILPPVVELPPGDIRQVKAIVSNLGELEDSILLRIEVPLDSGVGANVDEPSIISVIPHAIAEFNIMVTTSLDAPNEEVILSVIASSRRAPEYDLIVEERAELTVKILNKEKTDEDNPWLSLSEFWIIFLIIIIILIVLIIVWMVVKQKKTSQETKEESTPEDSVTIKPEIVPKAVISDGQVPPTGISPQLPGISTTVESEKPTSQIAKVPTLASSTTPGQVPEPKQIPQVTQVPQLSSANLETYETIEESAEETIPESDQLIDSNQEIDQSSQDKD